MSEMATKAKLSLSQLLFRRSSNNNSSSSNSASSNSNNGNASTVTAHNEACHKTEQFSSEKNTSSASFGSKDNSKIIHSNHSQSSSSAGNGSSGGDGGVGRQNFHEFHQHSEIMKANQPQKSCQHPMLHRQQQRQLPQQVLQVQQQLHGILKKPTGDFTSGGGLGGKSHRSSLHRSKSNPNPSNNPLKEVSWSCPTLEKRREVILNYFERIILENKQEQEKNEQINNKAMAKPNIPYEGGGGNGEPIYEEIFDYSSPQQLLSNDKNSSNNKMGSLKPKLGPKKVRMNIPQDNLHFNKNGNNGQSPIYDKVLCRSQSMHESSPSAFYDIVPSSVATSISSSGSHPSLYENFHPSTYYPRSTSSSSSDSDYGTVGGGYKISDGNRGKNVTTRIAGRSHSFHDNYRSSGNYNILPSTPLTTSNAIDTDQLYAKVCKRKKLKANCSELQNHYQRPLSSSTTITTAKSGYHPEGDEDVNGVENENQLHVQVSCGNVVTMIPVMMSCAKTSTAAASSSFSTSCLSLSSSSDNNNDDMMTTTITTSISSINTRANNNNSTNRNNGHCHYYDADKIIPDKDIAYANNNKMEGSGSGGDSCPASSAAARNRNNLSVIHLLAAYDATKEMEEFIPTPGASFTAIIDSTETAPKSISVPVRVGFSSFPGSSNNNNKSANKRNEQDEKNEIKATTSYPPKPLVVTNCNFYGYDNDAFQNDDADADDEDNGSSDHHPKKLLRRSNNSIITKDDTFSSSSSSGTSASGAEEEDDDEVDGVSSNKSSGPSDSDTDQDEHHTEKYSFTTNYGDGQDRVLNNSGNLPADHCNNRVKRITFQEDIINTSRTTAKDLLLLTTSESEDDEELCEHKSLLEMNHSATAEGEVILGDHSSGKEDKYEMSLIDDEDRGFDSFLDETENNGVGGDGDSPFASENLRNQRTFAQMTQNVPPEQLKKKAASVLDLINSEISDLHMRELELKKFHSPPPPVGMTGSQEDEKQGNDGSAEEFEEASSGEDDFSDSAIEYDGFTTNGSHSSGQVSPSENLSEMMSHHQEQQQQREETEETSKSEEDKEETKLSKDGDSVDMLRSEVKVRPLEEEEDRSIKFLVSDETPIEREIRLTREREEEFRRNNHNYLAICPPAPTSYSSPAPKTTGSLPMMKSRDVSSRPEGKPDIPFPVSPSAAAAKEMQLKMATARFKKEIEESMNREKELIRETRQIKIGGGGGEEETVEVPEQQQEEEHQIVKETPGPQTPVKPSPPQAPSAPESQSQLRKPTLAKLPIAKLPAARFFSPPAFNANKPSRITPVVSPIISKGNLGFQYPSAGNNGAVVGGSLPVGMSRPSFTSFEKYIMQTSSNILASKQQQNSGSTPTGANSATVEDQPKTIADPGVVNKNLQFNIPEDPLRIIQKPPAQEESGEGGDSREQEEEEKPKRRYIPAQDKIHKEIQELVMREKELNRTRAKWKSTLDLPEALKDAEEDQKETLRRTTSSATQSSLSLNTSSISKENAVVATNGGAGIESQSEETENATKNDAESDDLNLDNVTSEDVRQVTRVKAPARRRHSMLISQWEERIRQQQQQNNKK